METIKLYYFSVFAKTESVRKTAEIINVSPSAISKALRQMEEELGVALIAPFGRGVVLTEEGRKFALEASAIVERISNLKDFIKKEKKVKEESPLKIASFEVFSTYFLHVLEKIELSNKSLVIYDLGPGEIERAVAEGHADYGISYLPSPHPNIEYLKISTIEMGVFKKRGTFKNLKQFELPFENKEYQAALFENDFISLMIFYFIPDEDKIGIEVKQGDRIGIAQDISQAYNTKKRKMTPHINLHVLSIDPLALMF